MRQECLTQAVNFTNWEHFWRVCDKNLYETVSHTSFVKTVKSLIGYALRIAIYLTSIIKPSFYYPFVAVGKILAVAGFLSGRDCKIFADRDSEKECVYASFSESSRSAKFC